MMSRPANLTRSCLGWGALVSITFSLAGCLTLPTAGPVNQVTGDREPKPAEIPFVAEGPKAGENPKEIVQGFLQSFAASGKGYQESLKYLHPEARLRWNPKAQTGVYDDADVTLSGGNEVLSARVPGMPSRTDADGDVKVQLEAKQLFYLDSKGVRYRSPAESRVNQTFTLRKDNGEWRIRQLNDGVFIAKPYFDLAYEASVLYFRGGQAKTLVPDVRWLLKRDGSATQLTEALLAGPGGELDGVASSGFPAGTTLAVPQTVRTRDGVAEVNLRSSFKNTTPEQRALVQAQLNATLTQLSGVSGVRITVDSVPLDVAEDAAREFSLPKVATSPLIALRQGKVVTVNSSGTVAEQKWIKTVADKPLSGIAVRPGSSDSPAWFAATSKDRKHFSVFSKNTAETGRLLLRTTEREVTDPSIDSFGYIWLGERNGEDVWVYSRNGTGYPLARSWGAEGKTRILRISPDGTRLAVASQLSERRWEIVVAGVARSAEGRPETLAYERSRQIGLSYDRILDMGWINARSLGVLASTYAKKTPTPKVSATKVTATPVPTVKKSSWSKPFMQSVDISGAQGGKSLAYADASALAAAGSLQGAIVQSGRDGLFQQNRSRWRYMPNTQGLVAPRFPG